MPMANPQCSRKHNIRELQHNSCILCIVTLLTGTMITDGSHLLKNTEQLWEHVLCTTITKLVHVNKDAWGLLFFKTMAYLQGVASGKSGSESQQQGSDHETQMTLSSTQCDVTLAVCQSLMCSKYNR